MKKKKKKKVPINLDDLDALEPAITIEVPKTEENVESSDKQKTDKSVIAEDNDYDDFSSLKKKKRKKKTVFDMDGCSEALPVNFPYIILFLFYLILKKFHCIANLFFISSCLRCQYHTAS